MSFRCVDRFVDPDFGWDRCLFGGLAHEAFGIDSIGGIENSLALFEDERSLVVADHGRREQRRLEWRCSWLYQRKNPCEAARRPLKIGVHGEHLCGLVDHGCYQQSKTHDLELELLFTQAETAW